MKDSDPVHTQYERFPYPPLSALALPQRKQGESLRYEWGLQFAHAKFTPPTLVSPSLPSTKVVPRNSKHGGIRILVAGCGTLEALVVAQSHPQASEIVAVDFSQTTLTRLKRRITWAKWARFPFFRLPRIRTVCTDMTQPLPESIAGQKYDYIIASNFIHHVQNPAELLKTLARLLTSEGILRVVTYPQASRLWMRETGKWLRWKGLTPQTPHLVAQAQAWIQTLPSEHPIRLCFETHIEAQTSTGVTDAFLHACENPLSPLQWKDAAEKAGLNWIGESQNETSRTSFLQEVMPTLQNLDRWAKLQILDSLLELCANPVLWFKRNTEIIHSVPTISFPTLPPRIRLLPGLLPSRVFWEMKQNLLLCQELIQGSGTSLAELFHQLQKEVGSRVHPQDPQKILPGLAVTDYSLEKILLAEEPWFCPEIPAEPRLRCPYVPNEFTAPIPGTSLAQQIEWLQLQFGHRGPFIPIQIV